MSWSRPPATGCTRHFAIRTTRSPRRSSSSACLRDPGSTGGLALGVRCGVHAGVVECRDGDYFGSAVNRTARIMDAGHGGQVLVSQAAADLASDRLPDGVSLRDLGAVRLRDLSGTERVYQVAHADLRRTSRRCARWRRRRTTCRSRSRRSSGASASSPRSRGCWGTTRLLTLLGAGGIGKTRLSLQAAADLLDDYRDGVWFVELAPIADERLVPQAAASVLGVKEEAGIPWSTHWSAIVRPPTAADPRQLRAPGAGLRRAGRPAAAGRRAARRCWRPVAKPCGVRARRRTRCRRSRSPTRTTSSRSTR